MAQISEKKLRIIKRRFGQQSIAEIAKDLNLKEKDVRQAVKTLGLETPKDRGELKAQLAIALGDHSPRWTLAFAILALVLTFLCFGGSIHNPMVFDDHHSILDNNYIHEMGNVGEFFVNPNMFSNEPERRMYRPIVLLTYALNYAANKYNPTNWHIVNLLFHALNGFLIFLIFDMIFRSHRSALLFAALFIVHPVVSESVVYLSARSTLMAGAFLFGSIYVYLRGAKSGGAWKWTAITSSCFLVGILCKENVFMLLPIILAGEWLLGTRPSDFISSGRWKVHAPIWVIAGAYLLFRRHGFTLPLPTLVLSRPERPFYMQLLTQAGVWLDYLGKILWPINLNTQPRVDFIKSLQWINGAGITGQPIVWLFTWAALVALVVVGRRNSLMALGVAFATIVLLPETLTAMNQAYTERRMYLPLFGMIIIVGGIYGTVTKEKYRQLTFYLLIAAIVCMIPMSYKRVLAWRSEKALWLDSVAKAPDSEISWHGLGYVYGQDGEQADRDKDQRARIMYFRKALWALDRALLIDPQFAPSLRLKGALLLTLNKPKEALPYLEMAARREPLSHKGWYNLGLAQGQLGDSEGAIKSYRKSIALNKFYDQPHNNLAIILAGQGKYEEALKELLEALRLNPTNQDYQINIEQIKRTLQSLKSMPAPGEPGGPEIRTHIAPH